MLQVSPAVFDAARIPELFHDRHSAGSGSAAESADDQKKRHALKQLFDPAAFMRNDTLTVEHAAAAAAAGTPARSGQQPRLLRQSRPLETGGIAVYGEEAQRSRKRILPQDADDPAAGSADSEYGDFLLFHSFSPAMRL